MAGEAPTWGKIIPTWIFIPSFHFFTTKFLQSTHFLGNNKNLHQLYQIFGRWPSGKTSHVMLQKPQRLRWSRLIFVFTHFVLKSVANIWRGQPISLGIANTFIVHIYISFITPTLLYTPHWTGLYSDWHTWSKQPGSVGQKLPSGPETLRLHSRQFLKNMCRYSETKISYA